MSVTDLPALNAFLNTCSTVLLSFGFYFIKRKNQQAHIRCMVGALITSALFLTSYLYYHSHAGRVVFANPQWFRPIYLVILLTHTILAVVILPLIFVTVVRGLKRQDEKHRKIARWTWPLWMYVSVTGVLIYFLLYVIFPQARSGAGV
ncbi:MAG TPA: DUF420 domain-containing protein [Methylomirabilota bacterium]|nr:DUF420 domain-containing protein [Methylomirabilota bacterium]